MNIHTRMGENVQNCVSIIQSRIVLIKIYSFKPLERQKDNNSNIDVFPQMYTPGR